MLFCSVQDTNILEMQNNISKTQNTEFPSNEGRAYHELICKFFNYAGSECFNELLFEMLHHHIPNCIDADDASRKISDSVFEVRLISKLLQDLEAINKEQGGPFRNNGSVM